MQMRMGQRQVMRQVQGLCCNLCGEYDGHKHGCLRLVLENLIENQVNARCPDCPEGRVTNNASDFLECRKCHTQYTTGAMFGTKNTCMIDLPDKFGGYQVVDRLEEKGNGDFPLDQRISEIHYEINKQLKKQKRRKK